MLVLVNDNFDGAHETYATPNNGLMTSLQNIMLLFVQMNVNVLAALEG